LLAVLAEECDLVEVAAPTRWPVMDGPSMSSAYAAAIGSGYDTTDLFRLIRCVAPAGTPVVVVAYWQTINAHGPARFAADLAHAGGAGVVVPDIPPGALPAWQRAADQHGLHTVRVAPADAPLPEQVRIAAASTGMLYAQARPGPTGSCGPLPPELRARVEYLRTATGLPVAAGFGIHSPQRAAEVAAYADAVIVGSALVDQVQAHPGAAAAALRSLAADLAAAVTETRPHQAPLPVATPPRPHPRNASKHGSRP
jgi:tryptophan synthase alpha chain